MNPQGTPAALGQDLEIAARLRRLDHAEGVFLAGHRQILGVLAGDLQEDAAVRAALVGLPGRMQKARAEAEAGRRFGAVADHPAPALQRRDMAGAAFDIGEQTRIVAGADAAEMGLERRGQAGRRGRQRRRVPRVGEEAEAAVGEKRLLLRQCPGLLVGRGQIAGLDLARLDIGLVERVDADDRAGDRGRHLPAEEFLSELHRVGDDDPHHRLARRFERGDRVLLLGILVSGEPQIGEEPVVAVDRGGSERLGVDRHDPLAELAGRLGQ